MARAQDIDALLDTVQHAAFNFFWDEGNSLGLVPDAARVNGGSNAPCSIASLGFGLTAINIGVDHGWVSRQAAAERVLAALKTLYFGAQGNGDGYTSLFGLYYHFLDMYKATRALNSELSTIDTALLLAGIIDSREYFDGSDATESSIRAYADTIYHRMNWDLMRNYHPGILMAWWPGTGFESNQWHGYCEAMIMYILAAGSPTHPIDSTGWTEWTKGYVWVNYYGINYLGFAPLFGHQYSHCWIDFRGIADSYMRAKGIDYFENSRRATYAQRAYCIDNAGRFAGYSDSLWGITASDDINGYCARGAPPDQGDDGTLVPTAPISSIVFAPEIVIPVLRNMWNNYRPQLWGKYGFRDAFNLGQNWWCPDVVGIDQGPEIIMIENYRTGKVWKRFMQNADVQRGLAVMGFRSVNSVPESAEAPAGFRLDQNYPNPFNPSTTIRYALPRRSFVTLTVLNALGQRVALLESGERDAGIHEVTFDGSNLASGVYVYRVQAGTFAETKKALLVR
jgi:hypothetical protein